MAVWVAIIKDADGGQVAGIVPLMPKDFSTGSHGLYGSVKLDIGGARHQVAVQAVRIGSKVATPDADNSIETA